MSKQVSSVIFKIHIGMGIYGFTRGYRAEDKLNTPERLIGEKLLNGIMNGYMYCLPVYNVKWIHNLLNRVEVKYRNLDKKVYEKNYEESCGICDDTI